MTSILACDHPALVLEFHAGVDRNSILESLRRCSYDLPGEAVGADRQTVVGEYLDNSSYVSCVGGWKESGV